MAKKQGKSTNPRGGFANGVKAVSRPAPKTKAKPGRGRFANS